MPLNRILDNSLLLDLETLEDNRLTKIGAVCRGESLEKKGRFNHADALRQLDAMAEPAEFVLGHNLLGHDLPVLQALAPDLKLLKKPVIDTLYLSPLAFPENPYHRLVKDYKLVRSSINDPVADARLAADIFSDQWQAFAALPEDQKEVLSFYRYCFEGVPSDVLSGRGLAGVFAGLGGEKIGENQAFEIFQRHVTGKTCETGLVMAAFRHLLDPSRRPNLAYCLAWLQVAGHNSVLPPWVRHRFPDVVPVLRELRDIPCGKADCAYCLETHDPRRQLQKYFGFENFRPTPAAPDGGSLQESIVLHGFADKPHLAILPTGGGKSLCFQLPALARHYRRGVLTLVVSPLQALMKDQVDNLRRMTGTPCAAALYGMLTPPERGEVLERVRLGDIGILYVSPEQLRNVSFREAIRSREIGCWVFDEAHCLSKWGHDFRPDYLYASRFIREFAAEQKTPIPPIICFTATAKNDVMEEIVDHFRRELAQELEVFQGGVERGNLAFEVQLVTEAEKAERVHHLLSERLSRPDMGSAVIFCATRKRTEFFERFLADKKWSVAAFHAGLETPLKRDIQERFIAGGIQVICATNAFGMGIDKDNVRLVIHADIPGSLENYLQEAGRAGRDRQAAECILLYNEQDIETQFRLGSFSELNVHDIRQILRGIRRARRNKDGEIVITTGDLLRDEQVQTSFDGEDSQADTKVKTAVAWLERTGFIERNHNRTSVFQGRPLVDSLEEAEKKVERLNLSARQRERWCAVLSALFNAKSDEGMSADELAELAVFRPAEGESGQRESEASQLVLRTLHDMSEAGLLREGMQLTAYVRYKVKDPSQQQLEKVCALEEAMLKVMQEEAPDPEGWMTLSLRRLNQRLLDSGHICIPDMLRDLLTSLAHDGKGLAGKRGSIEFRHLGGDQFRVKLQRDWPQLLETAQRRREVAQAALNAILAKIPEKTAASGSLLVAFGIDDIAGAIRSDLFLAGKLNDMLAAIDRALMFLHEQRVIILQQGLAVFRQAMTIKVMGEGKSRYQKKDFEPLALHYKERTFQVHVMNEYARLGSEKIRQALDFVLAYFSLDRMSFIRRFFGNRKEILERATSAESYRRIVENLGNQVQCGIVSAPADENMLILAGPGSGKTRTVVHRCAYLLRVERVPGRSILILCFNRSAAVSLRRRLYELLGDDARGVMVQTYHGLAMRLSGLSFAENLDRHKMEGDHFAELIANATRLLKGEIDLPGLANDEVRERLLAGFRFILVDEYQDIDEAQYELISALAGRTQPDSEYKLAILAVGDDDQNIYASFRHTNVRFIRQFQEDYQAKLYHLIENYRSTAHIISAANCLIAHNGERMKVAHPITINHGRRPLPPGGSWENLDPVAKGKVQLCRVPDAGGQAVALVAEIQRLRQRNPSLKWEEIAVLARTHEELVPIRALLEDQSIPVCWTEERDKLPPVFRIREIACFLDQLRHKRHQLATADVLLGWLDQQWPPETTNPWSDLLRDVLDTWRIESNNAEMPVEAARECLCDALLEYRRDPARGRGLFLGTVHGAKGMEFGHVLIPGGGWKTPKEPGGLEEERRVYYVGMTRAIETLCLFERQDVPHPHTPLLLGSFLHERQVEPLVLSDPALLARRYTVLGMRDIDLGFAGRKSPENPIHRHLADLTPGSFLRMENVDEDIWLIDGNGNQVARLSKAACSVWKERRSRVQAIKVLAMLQWRQNDSDEEFSRYYRCEQWEVPLVEIIWSGL